jgi:phosphoenolpyruvate carboxykinase (ATP)
MPMDPSVYAEMLGEKLEKYGTKVYLVNTGWAGGSASDGASRMKLSYTRAMVSAALNGDFDNIEFKHHDVFNVDYPVSCPNVPDEKLDARGMWADQAAYDEQANKLAQMFADNFAKKYPNMPAEIVNAGPKPVK